MGKDKWFILEEEVGKDHIWYVCALSYNDFPDSSWILSPTVTQKRKNAMQFCKSKAEKLAEVLSGQIDEEGYSSQYKVVNVQELSGFKCYKGKTDE